jgi:hypothetical protein
LTVKQMIDIRITDPANPTDMPIAPLGAHPCALSAFFDQTVLTTGQEITMLSIDGECTRSFVKQAVEGIERMSPGALDTLQLHKSTPLDEALLEYVLKECTGIKMIASCGHARSIKVPSKGIDLVDLLTLSRSLASADIRSELRVLQVMLDCGGPDRLKSIDWQDQDVYMHLGQLDHLTLYLFNGSLDSLEPLDIACPLAGLMGRGGTVEVKPHDLFYDESIDPGTYEEQSRSIERCIERLRG